MLDTTSLAPEQIWPIVDEIAGDNEVFKNMPILQKLVLTCVILETSGPWFASQKNTSWIPYSRQVQDGCPFLKLWACTITAKTQHTS